MLKWFHNLVFEGLDKLYSKSDSQANLSQENTSQSQQTQQSNDQIGSSLRRGDQSYSTGANDLNQAGGYYGSLASSGGTAGVNQSIVNQMSGLGGNGGSSGGSSGGGSGGGGGNSGSSGNGQFQLRNFAEADPYNQSLASTGGVDMGALTSTVNDYKNLAANPVDATRQATVEGDLGNLRKLGQDSTTQNNFLGNGVYKNLSETGGYDDAQKNNFLQRATSTVPAVYQQMADEMARRRSVQGGYAPAFDKSSALLSRQGAQATSDAARNASLDLNSQINSNKLAGAQGLTAGQSGLSNLQLQGTQSAQQGEQSLQDLINNYKMQALGAQTSENQQAQQIAQQGKIAGAGFLTTEGSKLTDQDIAANQAAAAASMNSANINAANQRYVLGLENSSQMSGIQGLQSIGGQFLGNGLNYDQLGGSELGQQMNYTTGMYGAKQGSANANPNFLQSLGGIAGSIGGAIPGVSSMFGSGSNGSQGGGGFNSYGSPYGGYYGGNMTGGNYFGQSMQSTGLPPGYLQY